jgi:hypothetical protein
VWKYTVLLHVMTGSVYVRGLYEWKIIVAVLNNNSNHNNKFWKELIHLLSLHN